MIVVFLHVVTRFFHLGTTVLIRIWLVTSTWTLHLEAALYSCNMQKLIFCSSFTDGKCASVYVCCELASKRPKDWFWTISDMKAYIFDGRRLRISIAVTTTCFHGSSKIMLCVHIGYCQSLNLCVATITLTFQTDRYQTFTSQCMLFSR